jgi:hypothetical protein
MLCLSGLWRERVFGSDNYPNSSVHATDGCQSNDHAAMDAAALQNSFQISHLSQALIHFEADYIVQARSRPPFD